MMSNNNLSTDIEMVQQIPIVPTMLEVICKVTGMGFAAIARVTEDRWIACSVRDEIQFGLQPGGELSVETTICNEIRTNQQAVIIDHVAESETFRVHHTPLMYGFQSYISVPIILKNGEFFGTLCAIDPSPAQLNNPKIIGMFNLFVELISFHLHNLETIKRSSNALLEMNRQLMDFREENRQYRHISNHDLQEPLRKIRFFSSMLIDTAEKMDAYSSIEIATKINTNAQRMSMMLRDLSEYSDLDAGDALMEDVDLNKIVADVCIQLSSRLSASNASINTDPLPVLKAGHIQMEQLFYHLIDNALKFSRRDVALEVQIRCVKRSLEEVRQIEPSAGGAAYYEISVEDNGIGIERSQLKHIFDIFSRLQHDPLSESQGSGLAYCRKIIRNHGGFITARSVPGEGSVFSILLPG